MGVTTRRCGKPVAEPHGSHRGLVRAGTLDATARPRLHFLAGIGTSLAVLAAAGCAGSGVHAQDPSGSSSPAPSSSSPATQSAEQRAGAAAVTQVIRYEQMLDDLALHPARSLNELYTVGTQPDVTDEIATLLRFRQNGDRQSGIRRVTGTRVSSVSLRSDRAHRPPVYPTVQVSACVDVSGVTGVDRQGKSIVAPDRKRFQLTELTLVNSSYPDPTGWKVSKVTDQEQQTCHV